MKITLFTSNQNRHNYLINLLSSISNELFVIQECKTVFSDKILDQHSKSIIMEKYFEKVIEAQNKMFKKQYVTNNNKSVKTLPILTGELNKLSLSYLDEFLKSNIYIVFGSSYIKGELVEFLVKNKAINIHAGVSPYYRGADCNFWALYDGNPHLVGATIHMLSKGLDSGQILYHAMSNIKTNPYEYSMSTVKAAFHSITEKIQDRSIFKIETLVQDKDSEIRYSRKFEFNKEILKEYFRKKINLNSKKFDCSLLKEPYFLNN